MEKEEGAEGVEQTRPAVACASPVVRPAGQRVAGELNWGTSVQGVSVDFPLIHSWNLAQGDFFTDADVKAASKVCILGQTVVDNLFPNSDCIGQVVRIKNVPFTAVGGLEKKGGSLIGR